MDNHLLSIRNLRTSFRVDGEYYAAVDGVSLDVYKNEVLAIVGESGCGKSAFALSITGLHNKNFTRMEGEVLMDGQNLLQMTDAGLEKVRGRRVGMIFQDPLSALNPLMKIGKQIEEPLKYHTDLTKAQMHTKTIDLLGSVGIKDPAQTYERFPHELSGGMRQRVVIAAALAAGPQLIIADEPTTALDVTIQAQILDLLKDIRRQTMAGIILITHDLGVVAQVAHRVVVMYAGQIVECGSVGDVFKNPLHPYTRSLLASMPSRMSSGTDKLNTIQGSVPGLREMPRDGCRFAPRIPWITADAHEANPITHEIEPGHYVLCTCHTHFHFQHEGGR